MSRNPDNRAGVKTNEAPQAIGLAERSRAIEIPSADEVSRYSVQ